ncbi:hypothetical protein CC1G_05084 [Coprinopsis cinerea okayama7|uniref:Lysine decarboxylase n=1 Tax=Coprinopsis cinerea (strain Okayama-7 / 130 / ATCC MYA-4618 / FGSC 9003) TaxID=240176 RepID=A8NG99_COPC7|nr:hypothetical protein CC1G_05084 [Coprinopsis cinerea okayama7\|eukprot:XP_001833384.2 hypothetical protein CC1G_05084 [Coprinopsis cinerea okayama7\
MNQRSPSSGAIAVYCASSTGNHRAFASAAISVGKALASANRPLVYGGGSKGIMGIVSGACLDSGGKVTGIVPYAMVAAGGEGEKTKSSVMVELNEAGREKVETIVVDSMHERKVQMSVRSDGFIALPGGFGTFEELLEVTTWTQIGIHKKPVVLVNVLGFWNPLRELIRSSIGHGFISPQNEDIIVFVDGPEKLEEHETFDWGAAALKAIDGWTLEQETPAFQWTKGLDGKPRDVMEST